MYNTMGTPRVVLQRGKDNITREGEKLRNIILYIKIL